MTPNIFSGLPTPRFRTSRAEMEKMSETERQNRKKLQNRLNSQKCLAKKNEELDRLNKWTRDLEELYASLKTMNWQQEERLLEMYSSSGENLFGELEDFHKHVCAEKTNRLKQAAQLHQLAISILEQSFREADEKLSAILADTSKSVSPATFASRKSRARKQKELAELRLKTARLQAQFDEQLEAQTVLAEFHVKIGPKIDILSILNTN